MAMPKTGVRAVFAAFSLLLAMSTSSEEPDKRGADAFTPEAARRLMALGGSFPVIRPEEDMEAYVSHFRLRIEGLERKWGYIESRGKRLFVQSYAPPGPRGAVLFIHGYMDHGGSHERLYEYIGKRGYSVYSLDLPGHGLSEGARMDIDSFGEYGSAASALRKCAVNDGADPGNLVAMGHSTGCASWLICLEMEHPSFRRLVFACPLIRSNFWELSKAGIGLAGEGLRSIKRSNGPRKRKDLLPYPFAVDPLEPIEFPRSWIDALIEWDAVNRSYGPYDTPLVVIQGQDDTVVDYRYNLEFLKSRFGDAYRDAIIPRGSHYVFRYAAKQWDEARLVLDECLPEDEPGSSHAEQ